MSDIDELELDKNYEEASEIGSSDEEDEQSLYNEPKILNTNGENKEDEEDEEDEDDDDSINTEIEDDSEEDKEEYNEYEDEILINDEENNAAGSNKKITTKKFNSVQSVGLDDEDDDEEDDSYLQKFNEQINKNYIADNHPECVNINYDEIVALSKVVRDAKNNIVDDLHITLPYLTKYEKARILGQRAKQINLGMPVFVKVPENIIDGYLVAEMELTQKRIPFIIKRPIPGGGCEYWKVNDLELIAF